MKTTGELIERSVLIPPAELEGDLVIPEKATAVIAFAHGSGSSRHSPRNQYVARVLQQGGLATLLFDLLTGRPPFVAEDSMAVLARVLFDEPARVGTLRPNSDLILPCLRGDCQKQPHGSRKIRTRAICWSDTSEPALAQRQPSSLRLSVGVMYSQ